MLKNVMTKSGNYWTVFISLWYYNVSQTKKGKYERWQNVEGIFEITKPKLLENKHILIIDDILTTGSTIEACCAALLKVPGIRVSVVTVGVSSF